MTSYKLFDVIFEHSLMHFKKEVQEALDKGWTIINCSCTDDGHIAYLIIEVLESEAKSDD